MSNEDSGRKPAPERAITLPSFGVVHPSAITSGPKTSEVERPQSAVRDKVMAEIDEANTNHLDLIRTQPTPHDGIPKSIERSTSSLSATSGPQTEAPKSGIISRRTFDALRDYLEEDFK